MSDTEPPGPPPPAERTLADAFSGISAEEVMRAWIAGQTLAARDLAMQERARQNAIERSPPKPMKHYYAVAEPYGAGGFWISFPDRPGLASAAHNALEIVRQAQDALESVLEPADLPRSIEEGASPPADLGGYDRASLIVVIPFDAAVAVV